MSCGGCKALRRKCEDDCALRDSLAWIKGAQQEVTIYVHKVVGRAKVNELLQAAPAASRAELFVSLLYESCAREVNPITGIAGLTSSQWELCHAEVEKVMKGGKLEPPPGHRLPFGRTMTTGKKRSREEGGSTSVGESSGSTDVTAQHCPRDPKSALVVPGTKRVRPRECELNLDLSL